MHLGSGSRCLQAVQLYSHVVSLFAARSRSARGSAAAGNSHPRARWPLTRQNIPATARAVTTSDGKTLTNESWVNAYTKDFLAFTLDQFRMNWRYNHFE